MLEYLYKGDYSPKLAYDKKRASWYLEDNDAPTGENTIHLGGVGGAVLKDTVIYVRLQLQLHSYTFTDGSQCSAHRYNLPDLQRLALKKQGLQSGVQCATILSSARFAYANTPASDSKLRAHYLALIIRSRNTFKRSGTMQMEMEHGGTALFFDLFVAMVNHLVSSITKPHPHRRQHTQLTSSHRTTSPAATANRHTRHPLATRVHRRPVSHHSQLTEAWTGFRLLFVSSALLAIVTRYPYV